MAGSSEVASVRAYLTKLNRQAESIYGSLTGRDSCNIAKVLNQKGVVSLDIGLGNNDNIMSLIINHLLLLQSNQKSFSIIIDGIMLSKYPQLSDVLRDRTFSILHNDFIGSLASSSGKTNDLFSEISAYVSVLVLFNHNSTTNCQKWAEHLGRYKKIKIKNHISTTNSPTSWLVKGSSRGITDEETTELRVPAETLSIMPPNLACIHRKEGILFAQI